VTKYIVVYQERLFITAKHCPACNLVVCASCPDIEGKPETKAIKTKAIKTKASQCVCVADTFTTFTFLQRMSQD